MILKILPNWHECLTLFLPGVVTWYTNRGLILPSAGRNRVKVSSWKANEFEPRTFVTLKIVKSWESLGIDGLLWLHRKKCLDATLPKLILKCEFDQCVVVNKLIQAMSNDSVNNYIDCFVESKPISNTKTSSQKYLLCVINNIFCHHIVPVMFLRA